MKIIFLSLLCLILIGITSYSYAQYYMIDSHTILPEIMLQLELRDSDGNLRTYIESKKIIAFDQLMFNKFFEKQNKEFLIKDGKAYEIIQFQGHTETFGRKHAMSLFILWGPEENTYKKVLAVAHNSYQVEPGDTLRVFWTIIRPVN